MEGDRRRAVECRKVRQPDPHSCGHPARVARVVAKRAKASPQLTRPCLPTMLAEGRDQAVNRQREDCSARQGTQPKPIERR